MEFMEENQLQVSLSPGPKADISFGELQLRELLPACCLNRLSVS